MKINFTKKQYGTLLRMIHMGEWIANSARHPHHPLKEYDDIAQYFYSFAKEFGYEEEVVYDKTIGEYIPTDVLEETTLAMIEEYINEVFWPELASRLARRDLEESRALFPTHDDYMRKFFEIETNYEEEFYENGLKNIKVNHPHKNEGHSND